MSNSAHLGLPFIEAAQAQKHVTHNEAIRALDDVVQLSVLDRNLTSPPASPADGDRYIAGDSASGGWSGKDGQIASWQDGAWVFYPPNEGWLAWVADEAVLLVWDGTTWGQVSSPDDGGDSVSVNPVSLVGINATADTTNRLSVNSPAALFNHEGNGHQIRVNKNAVADDASFTFQTNFSSRALIGLLADDSLSVKVTPDGSTFYNGLVIDKDDGMVSMPEHSKFTATSNFDNYIASNAWTKIQFNISDHNDQGDFSTSNNHFDAPADGYYNFGALINFKENGAHPSFIAIQLYVGGVAVSYTSQRYTGATGTLETGLNTHALLRLNAADQVDVRVYFATNDGYVEANSCAFWGVKIP